MLNGLEDLVRYWATTLSHSSSVQNQQTGPEKVQDHLDEMARNGWVLVSANTNYIPDHLTIWDFYWRSDSLYPPSS